MPRCESCGKDTLEVYRRGDGPLQCLTCLRGLVRPDPEVVALRAVADAARAYRNCECSEINHPEAMRWVRRALDDALDALDAAGGGNG